MTGYYLDIGYNSGYDADRAWDALKSAIGLLAKDPERIVNEVLRVEGHKFQAESVLEYAQCYDGTDLSMTIVEEPAIPDEDFRPYVRQLASGGGVERRLKEATRRAVCRLLIEEMHHKGIEVNMRVV